MINRPREFAVLTLAALLSGCGPSEQGPKPISIAEITAFLQDPGLEKSSFSPYIRGKVLVLNRTDGGTQPQVQSLLAPSLSARTAPEVETVVWIDWSPQQVSGDAYKTSFQVKGHVKKLPAVVWNADVTVIDWARKRMLGGPRLTGPAPNEDRGSQSEQELLKAGGVAGPRPFQEIADYLAETARAVAVPP